ncbi:MAG: cytochrome c [Verrucomicrobiota bacterium]
MSIMSSSDGPDLRDIDTQHHASIAEVHGSVKREKSEPTISQAPVTGGVLLAGALILMISAAYLGTTSGGFRNDNLYSVTGKYTPAPPPGGGEGMGEEVEMTPEVWLAKGKKVYNNCMACHQANGGGLPPQFPPLEGSEWVINGTERLAMIILKAVQGPLMVKGQQYNQLMAYVGEQNLSDKEIAQVMSFIRNEWGNSGSFVTPAMVAYAREKYAYKNEPWVAAELEEVPIDAMLPGPEVDPADPATFEAFNQ